MMLSKEQLLSCMKPARYTGGEVGSITKDWESAKVRMALCFPDTYEIGMSHLGLRLLYDIVNRRPDALAERVFAPWTDMEALMRAQNILLWSLENQRPVRDFDILGFSLTFELSYANVLNVLSLSGLPLKSSERDAAHPLVIAGGSVCLNPEPMADFIDAFLIGEGEEVLGEVLDVVGKAKSEKWQRTQLFKALTKVPGVYVPSLYEPDESGRPLPREEGVPATITKRVVADLERVWDVASWIVPYIEIVHDRIGIEIMRGCPHRCRFCQARVGFYPYRLLKADKVLEVARRLYRMTGYEEISLLSLSSSDHPELARIATTLLKELGPEGVGVSLPSLRAKSVIGELSGLFSEHHKTSLTFAPEAGSERLRQVIHKDLNVDDLFSVAREAYSKGYRLLKLYFMIGLPTQTQEDLDGIVDLCVRLSEMKREVDKHPARLNVSISGFVPKPHTPFQWEKMASAVELKEQQDYLAEELKKRRGLIQLKFHNVHMSRVEAVLARGDRKVGAVIEAAWRAGARFDAWESHFHPALWEAVFAEQGLDAGIYTGPLAVDRSLPWSFVDAGVSHERLRQESCG